jgi:RNA polymerase sigma-70 factor, ECF subfamily
VLLMHDLEEYTHEEIAQALGIAPGSSRARLSRARALLRQSLADLASEDAR